MASTHNDENLNNAIKAAKTGDSKLARYLLLQILRHDSRSAQAWYWLGQVLDDPAQKKACLDHAAEFGLTAQMPDELPVFPSGEETRDDENAISEVVPMLESVRPDLYRENIMPVQPAPERAPMTRQLALAACVLLILVGLIIMLADHFQLKNVMGRLVPDEQATETYLEHSALVTEAVYDLRSGRGDDCIQMYNWLLEDMPNWEIGYYNRGGCKRMITDNMRNLSEYEQTLKSAIEDQDKAIQINPAFGDAYMERSFDYMELRNTVDTTADEQLLLDIAQENLRAAMVLGTKNPSVNINVPILLIRRNHCQEGIKEAYRLDNTHTANVPDSTLYAVMAEGHLCAGEYDKALPLINKSLESLDHMTTIQFKTAILIGLENLDQAMDVINQSIQNDPDLSGYRYYLRALIYYDRSQFDLARQDLEVGSLNTWDHGGLYAYLMGMLALNDGNQNDAINWLRIAADSVRPEEGLWVTQRIQDELARQNVKYVMPKAVRLWKVTPIPVH